MSESAKPIDWKHERSENTHVSIILVDDGPVCFAVLPTHCATPECTLPFVSFRFHPLISEHSAYDYRFDSYSISHSSSRLGWRMPQTIMK